MTHRADPQIPSRDLIAELRDNCPHEKDGLVGWCLGDCAYWRVADALERAESRIAAVLAYADALDDWCGKDTGTKREDVVVHRTIVNVVDNLRAALNGGEVRKILNGDQTP